MYFIVADMASSTMGNVAPTIAPSTAQPTPGKPRFTL